MPLGDESLIRCLLLFQAIKEVKYDRANGRKVFVERFLRRLFGKGWFQA